jgi:hypothetical protein
VLGGEASTWCEVSEFAFAYNGCLFNMAFSAEQLWWSHYRDSERSRLTAQVSGLLQKAHGMFTGSAVNVGGTPSTTTVVPASEQVKPVPFAPHLRGLCLDEKNPRAKLPIGTQAGALAFTLLCQTRQMRKATWELADPFHQPEENRLATCTVRYQGGESVDIPIDYGTQVGRWDIPYGEHIDAVPYEASPNQLGKALTGQPVTGYEWVWHNPHPEKGMDLIEVKYCGLPGGAVWMLERAG